MLDGDVVPGDPRPVEVARYATEDAARADASRRNTPPITIIGTRSTSIRPNPDRDAIMLWCSDHAFIRWVEASDHHRNIYRKRAARLRIHMETYEGVDEGVLP